MQDAWWGHTWEITGCSDSGAPRLVSTSPPVVIPQPPTMTLFCLPLSVAWLHILQLLCLQEKLNFLVQMFPFIAPIWFISFCCGLEVVVSGSLNGLHPTQSSENNVTTLADPRSIWCVKSIYLNLFASIGIWLFASCFHLMSFVLNTDKQNCFCVSFFFFLLSTVACSRPH